jgi:hypothetical protein
MISRRKFMNQSLKAAGASMLLPALYGCSQTPVCTGKMVGPNAALGHRLREMKFDPPVQSIQTDVLIIGGGVSGLSAARYLKQRNVNFTLLELGQEVGGNSIAGSNDVSAYPWGAHYLPLPNGNDPELLNFLRESSVITGEQDGLPVFNDYYLCFDPKERLFLNHFWQDGILPHEGLPLNDRNEIERFTTLMHAFKLKKGGDGKEAFAIPVAMSSQDPALLALDTISMKDFLTQHGFESKPLMWFVNYCCADDFGAAIEDVSAWAGIHYFASRKGKAANASDDTVLTWPEGNHFLVKKMRDQCVENIHTNTLVYQLKSEQDGVKTIAFDASRNSSIAYEAKCVVLATPQYINNKILREDQTVTEHFHYAPWMVANITLDASLGEKRGESLAWDNVIFGSQSVGYVNANHQDVRIAGKEKVITYYHPLTGSDTRQARLAAYERTYDAWKEMIIKDLSIAHPMIEQYMTNLDIWIWGHGMIRPAPDFIWGEARKRVAATIDEKIFKAHSDLSGISIFEEAFYQGHTAAKQCLNHL